MSLLAITTGGLLERRLGLLDQRTARRICERHETYSWYRKSTRGRPLADFRIPHAGACYPTSGGRPDPPESEEGARKCVRRKEPGARPLLLPRTRPCAPRPWSSSPHSSGWGAGRRTNYIRPRIGPFGLRVETRRMRLYGPPSLSSQSSGRQSRADNPYRLSSGASSASGRSGKRGSGERRRWVQGRSAGGIASPAQRRAIRECGMTQRTWQMR